MRQNGSCSWQCAMAGAGAPSQYLNKTPEWAINLNNMQQPRHVISCSIHCVRLSEQWFRKLNRQSGRQCRTLCRCALQIAIRCTGWYHRLASSTGGGRCLHDQHAHHPAARCVIQADIRISRVASSVAPRFRARII